MNNPDDNGQLIYPISLDGRNTSALLDHGASTCFIDRSWVCQNGCKTTDLIKPLRLVEFSGTSNVLKKQLHIQNVNFAGVQRSWSFLVSPNSSYPVVIGLDLIRSWPLYYNPCNDKILVVSSRDPTLIPLDAVSTKTNMALPPSSVCPSTTTTHTCSMALVYEEENDNEDVRISYSPPPISLESHESDTEMVEHVLQTPSAKILEDGTMLVTCHTVTASSDEEQEALKKFVDNLPSDLKAIVDKYPRLFSPPDAIPPEREVIHDIKLKPDVVPVRRPPYPLGEAKLEAMKTQIGELADKGWIVPSSSPWGAPILFVKKKEGEWRMCIDFRDLNALTVDDSFPLPRLDLLIHRAGASQYFSKIDLASGFHQIALSSLTCELTAFRLPEPVKGNTHWEWKVMPFGLKNAPPTFQRAMTRALRGGEDFAVVYMDDVMIFSQTREEHLNHLDQVFHKLDQQSYHIRLPKCEFMKREVEFLGHQLSTEGVRTSPGKVAALQAWKPPLQGSKQVKQFLGLVMWYRSFIAHLATIASPLFSLTSTRKNFVWTEAATQAVQTLQHLVSQAPCLARWDRERKTRVVTDASKIGLGAVLEQWYEKEWRPIAFWSRKLRDPETRYSTTDREWLAVVEAVSVKWKGFLEDKSFLVCSDHMALERKLHKSSHDPPITDRQSRWIERLMPFALTFEYIKGENNVVADALSRCPLVANSITVVRSMLAGLMIRMKVVAETDEEYIELRRKAIEDDNSLRIVDQLVLDEDDCVFVPRDDSLRTLLISEAHDSSVGGHFGEERTLEMMKRNWRWRGMTTDVIDYVRSCVKCQKTKHDTRKPAGLLFPIVAQCPWHIVTMDFVSKFASAANTHHNQCLVIIDKFTKYTILEGCHTTIDAKDTARIFIKRVIAPFGVPKVVISDRGPQFSSAVWKEILNIFGTRIALAATHHPQTDGQSERAIQTVLRMVRAFATEQQELWEDMLPMFELALNHANNRSTKHSPFQMLFGRSPRVPLDFAMDNFNENPENLIVPPSASQWVRKWNKARKKLWDFVRENQLKVATEMKRRYDHGRKPMHLEPGDLVLLSVRSHAALGGIRKHRERYVGPYIVGIRVHDNAYTLIGLPPGVPSTQNVQYLRLFLPSPVRFSTRPNPEYAKPYDVEGQTEWEVEKIVGHKSYRDTYRYRVKWKDTPQEQWLGEGNLIHCKELLCEYHRQHQLPLTPFLTVTQDGVSQDEMSSESSDEDTPPNPLLSTSSASPLQLEMDDESMTSSPNPLHLLTFPRLQQALDHVPPLLSQQEATPPSTPLHPLPLENPPSSRALRRLRRERVKGLSPPYWKPRKSRRNPSLPPEEDQDLMETNEDQITQRLFETPPEDVSSPTASNSGIPSPETTPSGHSPASSSLSPQETPSSTSSPHGVLEVDSQHSSTSSEMNDE